MAQSASETSIEITLVATYCTHYWNGFLYSDGIWQAELKVTTVPE